MHPDLSLVGTVRYPLGPDAVVRVFEPGQGKPINNERFAALVRQVHKENPFGFGKCYGNTSKICLNGWSNGWKKHELVAYAGWLLFDSGRDHPCHHAWVVYRDEAVIDMGNLAQATTLEGPFMEEWDRKGKEVAAAGGDVFEFNIRWRETWCRLLKPLEDGDPTENRVWGVVPPKLHYAGHPCDWDEAARIYNRWFKQFGKKTNDPAPGEASPSQYITQLIGEGKTSEEILALSREKFGGTE